MNISEKIHTYLTTAASSEFLEQPVEILDHWQGSENLLWRVDCGSQEFALKLYLDAGQARSRRQFDGQQMFAPLGLAPRPRWYDRHPPGLARQVLVYEWLPGDGLDVQDATQMQALAIAIARLHSGDPTDVHRFCPHPVNLAYFGRVLDGSIRTIQEWLKRPVVEEIARLFDSLAHKSTRLIEAALPLWEGVSPTPVHGDLRLENCVQHFGNIGLLDWEMFGLGDPALDVASFLQWVSQAWTADHQAQWLESYLSCAIQPGLAERIEIYGQILPFQNVCYLLNGIRQMQAVPESRQQLAENQDFLAATLHASLEHALANSQTERPALAEAISHIF